MNVIASIRLIACSLAAAAALVAPTAHAQAAAPKSVPAAPAAVAPATPAATPAAVDANRATQAELESLRGVGPSLAGKIVAERQKGAFRDWPDMIARVAGVGEKSAAKLSAAGMTVGGATYVANVAAAPAKTAKKAN